MTEFKDSEGRNWTLNLTIGSAKYLYDKTEINLLNPSEMMEGDSLVRLFSDDLYVSKIVWTLISKQAEQRKLDEETVLASFDGETMVKAQDAFIREYHNFFMARGNTQIAKMLLDTMNSVKEAMKETEESAGEKSQESPDAPESATTETTLGTN